MFSIKKDDNGLSSNDKRVEIETDFVPQKHRMCTHCRSFNHYFWDCGLEVASIEDIINMMNNQED